jgi:hypothetical protein
MGMALYVQLCGMVRSKGKHHCHLCSLIKLEKSLLDKLRPSWLAEGWQHTAIGGLRKVEGERRTIQVYHKPGRRWSADIYFAKSKQHEHTHFWPSQEKAKEAAYRMISTRLLADYRPERRVHNLGFGPLAYLNQRGRRDDLSSS